MYSNSALPTYITSKPFLLLFLLSLSALLSVLYRRPLKSTRGDMTHAVAPHHTACSTYFILLCSTYYIYLWRPGYNIYLYKLFYLNRVIESAPQLFISLDLD